MNGVGTRTSRDVDEFIDPKVALSRRARADRIRLVGIANVERRAVAFRIDSDGRNAHFAAGTDDAHRDLAAVGDEDLLHSKRGLLYFV